MQFWTHLSINIVMTIDSIESIINTVTAIAKLL